MQKKANNTEQAKAYIQEFCKLAKEPFYSASPLQGGTQHPIFLVNKKYVFKLGSANKVRAEFVFNNYYKNEKYVQKLVLCDNKYRYIVYNHIKGGNVEIYPNQKQTHKIVNKFIKNYQPFAEVGFGDLNKPSASWTAFLHKLVSDSKSTLKGYFNKEYFARVEQAIDTLEQYEFDKKLLHGDLRLENFIFEDDVLQGIIDPYPMIGDPLYDALFFHFSTPELAQSVPLHKLHKKLKAPKEKVTALALVVLCVKIKRMIKYNNHKQEFEFFKQLFEELANIN